MTTISEKNKKIIAEAFDAPDIKTELHTLLFGKYTPDVKSANMRQGERTDLPSIDGRLSQTQDNSTEFQKLLEHSQDFRNFAKERIESEMTDFDRF